MVSGTVYLMIAEVVFFVVGYIIQAGMGRILGPEDYGVIGVLLSFVGIIRVLLSSGFPQAVSKYIAEDPVQLSAIMRTSRNVQILLCLIFFGLYFGLADILAQLLSDPDLASYIRVSAISIPAYGALAIYAAYLNGLKRFDRQALVSIFSSIVRLATVFILVVLGMKIYGVLVGYIVAASLGTVIAWRLLGRVDATGERFDWHKLVDFGVPATFFMISMMLLSNIDLYSVKRLTDLEAEVGYYTSTVIISQVPFMIFTPLAITMLPTISMSIARGDIELTRDYIRRSMRYMLMLLVPGVSLISAFAVELVRLIYSAEYLEAADSVSIRVLGMGALSVFLVLSRVVMGSGKPRLALMMVLPLIGVDIGLNAFMVPRYGLEGAAWATTITGILGLITIAVYIIAKFRALINPWSFARILLASLVVYVIALEIQVTQIWVLPVCAGLLGIYGGLLIMTREIGREDWETLQSVIPRRWRIQS